MGRKNKVLAGQKVGHLTVLKLSEVRNSRSFWDCQCDCGRIVTKSYVSLIQKRKNPLSCGCDLGYLQADYIELTYQGKTQSMAKWSKDLGIAIHTLKKRYSRKGKDDLEYLFKPIDPQVQAQAKHMVECRIHYQKPKVSHTTDDPRYPDLAPLKVQYYWEERQSVQQA